MANNCVADTLQALATCFIAEAKSSGQIVVDATYLTDEIRATLQRDDIVVAVNAGAIPPNPQDSLTICGTTPMEEADAFLDILGAPICLTFTMYGTAPNQQIVLQARTTLGTSWSFGQSFPEIVGQAADLLTFDAAYLYISSVPVAQSMNVSVCTDASNPPAIAIQPGVSVWCAANIAGPFETIVTLITGTQPPSLDLYGPVARRAGVPGPSIDLSLVNSLSFAIPGNIITVSGATAGLTVLYVATDPEEPTELTPMTVPYVQATVTVGGYALLISADLWESSSFVTFAIEAADPASTGMSFQDTQALVGSGGASNLLATVVSQPAVSTLLQSIEFKKFWGTVTLSPTPSLSNVALLVGTPGYDFDPNNPPPPKPPQAAWQPFSAVSIAFNFYGSVTSPVSSNPLPLAQLEATAWVTASSGPDYIFTAEVSVPDFIISGSFLGTIDINLARLVADLFGNALTLPNNLADFQLSDISLSSNVPAKSYAFGVTINGELFGANILQIVDTRVNLTVDASGESTAVTGTIDGIISLGGIEFAVTATISNAKNVDTVLQIHLVNETVGSLLGKLVQLVDPGFDLKLPTPWDKLLDINLDALVLEINVTKGSVGVSYNAKIDLGFLTIDTLSLTYQNDPVQSGVMIAIAGTFLGMSFGTNGTDPLAWDAVNGSPPSVPEGSLLDMRYLGIGQHVTVQGLENQQTMAEIITAMMNAMKTGQPDFSGGALVFSDSSGWLIGTDFTLASTVRLSIIFNDPKVYGLLLQLNGAKAGSFAGLSFEILYRKISDSIGLYHVDFTLPDEFRHLEFGEVSITLPSVIVDIYTNGNFLIDLGFPHNMDFSRSFSVQVFPFVGYAGIYFGLLSGATSNRVPQITNGSWNPVIVFGLGVSLGVGKTIDEGVFSAGISVTVQGVLEGVIGWFNPNSTAVPSDRYYWIQGTVRIVGQLYGTVDFGIIKASVSVTAYAGVTLVIEAYQPIYINLTAGVSVTASVKVVFFTIHFSFSMTISASWTIGSKGTPPWQVASGGGQQARATLFRGDLHPAGRFLAARATVERVVALRAAAGDASLQWTPVPQFYPSPQPLNVVVGPLFTVAAGAPQCVPLLFLENSIDPQAVTPAEVRLVADPQAAANQPFNLLAQALLHWAFVAWQRSVQNTDNTINMGALRYLQDQLTDPGAEDAAFPYTNLAQFLLNNVDLQLSPRPTTDVDDASAAIFPMIPALSMTVSGTTIYFDSRSSAQVDPQYAEKLAAYFAALMAEYSQGVAPDGSAPALRRAFAGDGTTESLATAVFRNYFFMIARAAVRSALDLLTAFPYNPGARSLAEICAYFPRVGDQEVTAESIVYTNQSAAGILTQQNVTLSGVVYQARSGDTLSSWLAPYGLTVLELLTSPYDTTGAINAVRPGLLQSGATLTVNSAKTPPTTPLVYTSQAGDTFALIASLLLVRSAGPSVYPSISGVAALVQAIVLQNNLQGTDPNAPLLPGVTSLQVPAGNPPAPVTYPVRPGDTLTAVAAYFLNAQQNVVQTQAFVSALTQAYPNIPPNNVPVGTQLTLPEIDHVVLPGDTVATIAAALLTDVPTLYNASNPAAIALQPLAAVPVPPFQYGVKATDNLAGIAANFNLTLDALAEAVLPQPSLFAAPITVPNVPGVLIDDLLAAVVDQGNLNTVSSTVSRFLMHGMQVPLPSDPITAQQLEEDPSIAAQVQTAPLYQLLGQQVATPAAPPTISFANADGVGWINFGQATYPVQQGDTLASILNAFVPTAQQQAFTTWLTSLNPGVNLQQLAPPTVLTFPTAAPLDASYTVQNPAGETLDAISEALAPAQPATLRLQIEQLNSGIDTTNPLPQGTVVTLPSSFPNQQLEVVLTSEELSLSSSLAGVTLDDQVSLYRLPLYNNTPYRYTTQKHLV
jgi:LysM repeat protein